MVLSNDGGDDLWPADAGDAGHALQPAEYPHRRIFAFGHDRSHDGNLYVVYQGFSAAATRKIFFTKSTNAGGSWSTPIAISDNPNTGVFNPAISASPDGQTPDRFSFYDQRDTAPEHASLQSLPRAILRRRRHLGAEPSPNE